ncbi:hypothetical protein BGZ63DRAFT_368208 [Mariannaea sp. PMI_226]|nr:hypothetical protein BGZ63DRAFT_368208 [Mariannaea sp. PMI_226]
MGSPVSTSPSLLIAHSTSIFLETPTPAPILPCSTPSPAPTLPSSTLPHTPIQYPKPLDEFVQDYVTYVNRAKIIKKTARLGPSHVWKYGLHYIRGSDNKEVFYCQECAVGKYKQKLFVINSTSGVRTHLERKHQIDPQSGIKKHC